MRKGIYIFCLLAAVGVALRLWVATLGSNYDMRSWDIVGALIQQGKSLYVNTFRYPYSPLGAYALGGMRFLSQILPLHLKGIQNFHLVLAFFLSLADVAMAYMVWRIAGLAGAAVVLLNPVSILISGFHSQLESFAITAALASWLMLVRAAETESKRAFYWSAAMLGLSLCIKHLFLFFPLWILMARGRFTWKLMPRIYYAAIAYAVFGFSFLAYCLVYPDSWDGIVKNVLQYRGLSLFGDSLVPRAIEQLAHLDDITQSPLKGLLTPLWVALVTLFGWLNRKKWDRLFYLYLICLLLFTPTIADQYLTDAVVVTAVFWWAWPSWAYTLLATACLAFSSNDIGGVFGWSDAISDTNWDFLSDWLYAEIALIPVLWFLMGLPLPGVRRRADGGEKTG